MNTICPICGKDDTAPFYDQQLKTHGFECHVCKKDFGVDDSTNKLDAYQKALTDFEYKNKKENGDTYIVRIHFGETTYLEPSIIYANKMCQPYEKQDITPMADSLKKLLFIQLFILDWKKDSLGFLLTNGNRSFEIHMNYKDNQFEPTTIKGLASFPPYLKVLDQLFQSFFATEEEK